MARPPSLESAALHSFQKLITQADSHGWSSLPSNSFSVRGPLYLDTKAKVPAGESLLQLIAFDLLRSSSKISNIMNRPHCRLRAALTAAEKSASSICMEVDKDGEHKPFVWVFNLQLPGKENQSIVMYYISFHKPEQGSLMQRFLDGTDAFRNERLKFLVNVPQGPKLMKLTVGEKGSASLLYKAFKCTYIKGKDYMEVDVDIGSSILASAAFRLCAKVIVYATIDMAFVVEGKDRSELPEQVLAGVRLENLDFSRAVPFDKPRDECNEQDKHTGSSTRGY